MSIAAAYGARRTTAPVAATERWEGVGAPRPRGWRRRRHTRSRWLEPYPLWRCAASRPMRARPSFRCGRRTSDSARRRRNGLGTPPTMAARPSTGSRSRSSAAHAWSATAVGRVESAAACRCRPARSTTSGTWERRPQGRGPCRGSAPPESECPRRIGHASETAARPQISSTRDRCWWTSGRTAAPPAAG